MKHTILLFFLLIINSVISQSLDTNTFEQKMKMEGQIKDYPWSYRMVFCDFKFHFVSEVFILPEQKYEYISHYSSDTVSLRDNGVGFTIFGASIEPRINLWSNSSSSIYAKFPLSFGFSIMTDGRIPSKDNGFFHFTLPALIGFASGLNSSFDNYSKSGFAISLGYQLHITPLAGGKTSSYLNENFTAIDEPYTHRKLFPMPVVQFDYYRLKKNANKIRGYSIAFCPYKTIYFKLGLSFPLTKK